MANANRVCDFRGRYRHENELGVEIMKTYFIDQNLKYDGSQLRPLYAYLNHQMLGDSIVSWVGPCEVSTDHMIDGEDLLSKSEIRGDRMVHFLIEKFDVLLFSGVLLQRLLASIVIDVLRENAKSKSIARALTRDGDDIYYGSQKFSISIATQTANSTLVHFAVNVVNRGTPVETLSLEDLGQEPISFAKLVLEKFSREVTSVIDATHKVKTF